MRRVLTGSAFGAVLTAAFFGAPAQAATVVFGPTSQIDVSTLAHQGPHVQGSSFRNVNGVESFRNVGPGGSASSSGSVAGVAGDAYIPGGFGDRTFTATAHGAASLANGTLKASVATTGGELFGGPGGDVTSQFFDTVHFTNTTAGDLALTLTWAFEGAFLSPTPAVSSTGSSFLQVSGCGSCGNLRFAGDGTGVGDVARALFNDHSVYGFNTFGGPIPLGDSAHWHTELFGDVGALISTTILIPTGESSLGIGAYLNISCRGGDTCDYGHTGTFRFGDLPTGLGFASESGLFLSAVGGPGAVPEPGVWALMILGFASAGASLRRRRARARTAAA